MRFIQKLLSETNAITIEENSETALPTTIARNVGEINFAYNMTTTALITAATILLIEKILPFLFILTTVIVNRSTITTIKQMHKNNIELKSDSSKSIIEIGDQKNSKKKTMIAVTTDEKVIHKKPSSVLSFSFFSKKIRIKL